MSLSNTTKTLESRKNHKYAEILGSPIAFHRVYATIAGSASAGLFLSQAMYWDSRTNDPQGWFYKTYEQWTSETALNRYELDKIRHHLTTINILETQLKGSPARLYYRINHKVLNNFLDVIKEGSFTSIRPKNKNTKKYSQISESVDGQQTDSVCLPSANLSVDGQQTSSMTVNNLSCSPSTNSIYIESTEITSEITHNAPLASPPAPPTQECVCEKEELDLTTEEIELEKPTPEEPTLQQLTSLLKKSEPSQQTDNTSCRSTIAAGSFEKSEQANNQLVAPNPKSASPTSLPDSTCYTMHPTEKTEQAMRESGLPPWMDKAGPNGWKTEFVESYRQYLNSTPRYAKELIRQATTGEAKNALTRLSKTDSGKAEIQNHWDSFNELKERQQHQQQHQQHQPHHSSDDALAKAIADDEERRRFEQQQHSWVPMPQKDAVALKAKLQAAASSAKVSSNSRPSSTNLREVEAQLKLAR
ncbi:hypothetical protein LC653_13290 [Nostoc sp. CHAB 5784]|uniref:hypothetical protein n=1 Tax=Nostoc mirabile TaxID=2907820 RepID=UPI001E5B0F1D|nr:hypothetical protein [Nostoc mirabile]MCC5664866.1 hypothetical protein [Nostoc mirabile CHAB5784]